MEFSHNCGSNLDVWVFPHSVSALLLFPHSVSAVLLFCKQELHLWLSSDLCGCSSVCLHHREAVTNRLSPLWTVTALFIFYPLHSQPAGSLPPSPPGMRGLYSSVCCSGCRQLRPHPRLLDSSGTWGPVQGGGPDSGSRQRMQ